MRHFSWKTLHFLHFLHASQKFHFNNICGFFHKSQHRSKNTKFQHFKILTEWYYYNKLVLESFYFQLDFLHTVWRWGNQAALGPAASFTNTDGVCVILPLHHAPLNTAGWVLLSEFLWKTFMKLQSEKAGDGKTTHKIIFVVFFCGVKSRWKTARVETCTKTRTKAHTKLIWTPISETKREIITLKTYTPFIGLCWRRLLKGRSPAVRERAANSSFASSSEFLSAPFQRLRTQCHALFMEDRTIVRRPVMEERLE